MDKKEEKLPDKVRENSKEQKSNGDIVEPTEIKEAIEKLPPQIQREFISTIEASMIRGTSSGHPLFDKFKDEHVTKYLDYSEEEEIRNHKLRCSNRNYTLVYSIIGIIVLVGLFVFLIIYLLPANRDLLVEIFKCVVIFLGGAGGGFGLKSHLNKRNNS